MLRVVGIPVGTTCASAAYRTGQEGGGYAPSPGPLHACVRIRPEVLRRLFLMAVPRFTYT